MDLTIGPNLNSCSQAKRNQFANNSKRDISFGAKLTVADFYEMFNPNKQVLTEPEKYAEFWRRVGKKMTGLQITDENFLSVANACSEKLAALKSKVIPQILKLDFYDMFLNIGEVTHIKPFRNFFGGRMVAIRATEIDVPDVKLS